MTAGTCSASPATEGELDMARTFPDPRHALRHRRRLARFPLSPNSSASPMSMAPSASRSRSPRPPARCARARARQPRHAVDLGPVHRRHGLFASPRRPVLAALRLAWGRMGKLERPRQRGAAGRRQLRRDLSGAVPQISGEPALGRQSRDHRLPHRALFRHDRHLDRRHGRGAQPRPLALARRHGALARGARSAARRIVAIIVVAYCVMPAINEVPRPSRRRCSGRSAPRARACS